MTTTKADKLLRSLIDAGLSLTEFTILATKILRIQHDLKVDNEDRRQRDYRRQQIRLREQNQFEQQLKDEEQRRIDGQNKLRQFGHVPNEENQTNETFDRTKTDQFFSPYSNQLNYFKQKQKDCCLTFNIDYDLRRNQQALERACKQAKRNINELRAQRFMQPDSRSILSVVTTTLHSKLKEAIREINKMFDQSKSEQDKRFLQELLTYINQYEGDIDLLMCQMQYEPKVKETILFSSVTTDILDRMNLILHQVRTIANRISTGDYLDENFDDELPREQPNHLPSKVTYVIKIQTNAQNSSALTDETNVNIKIYGTHSKSPEIRLLQSINQNKWQPGQIDLFNIELNYLGDLYAVELWHDGQYSSWKVDWIEIIDDAANIYRFPVDRIFDKYSEEKKTRFIIQRDLGPVNRLPNKPMKQIKSYHQIGFATYTVKVKTGKKPNKVTDSMIFMQLKGENGSFSDQLCSANSAFKSSVFEPDQLDTFYLVWPHLAKLNSLNLLVQSEGTHPPWFCEYITVEDGETGDKYKFVVNQLLDGSNPADPNLKRQVTVTPENTGQQDTKDKDKDKPAYIMRIKTGEKGLSNQSTVPSINVILQGEKAKSEAYPLKSPNNQRTLFQPNQTDEFVIPSKYHVGGIKNLQLSSTTPLDQWFIDNIVVRDVAQGQDYVFPLYKWFPSNQEGLSTLTVQPNNERKGIYRVYCRTIASELKGPDRSIKLTLQGSKGKQDIQLTNPISMANTFQPGRKDEFYLEDIQSLGDLQSIQVDVTHPNIKKLGLDYIEIKDLTTNDSYRFNINRMLDSKTSKMTSKAEVIPRSTANPTTAKTDSKSPSSNRPNFDQLTTNVPQGAKRSGKKPEEDLSNHIEDKSLSTTDYSSDVDHNKGISQSSEQVDKMKMKENKYFNTQLSKEFINSSEQSISNREGNRLQQGKTDSFTVSVPNDYDKVESKSKQQNLYRTDSDELYHRNNDKTHGLGYTSDDLSTSEKDQLPLTKSIKPYSNTNIREQTRPQGTAFPSSSTANKPPYSKPMETEAEDEEEDFSLLNQTITSSTSENLSKEFNSLSERNLNRQIRPGDRVKNNIKKQPTDRSSKSSIPTNQDHRNELKQFQTISDKHRSQTKFDQHDDSNQRSKKSSSRSLKQQKIPMEVINDKNRMDSKKISQTTQRSTTNRTRNSDHQLQENYSTLEKEKRKDHENSKPITRISSSTKQRSTVDSKQILQTNVTDNSTDTAIVSKNRMASNVSEFTKPIPPTNKERIETQSPPSKPEQKGIANPSSNQPISTLSQSRTSTDTPKRRSQSASPSRAPSNADSTMSKDPLTTLTKENKSPRTRANIPDTTFDEYHFHESTQNISSVTINTVETKSDSDVRVIRKSIDDQKSDHSLEKKSFLSPEHAKKSRKTSGSNTPDTPQKPSSNIPSDASMHNKPDRTISPTNDKYLEKETSNIQNAALPTLHRSPSNRSQQPIELQRSEPLSERVKESQDSILKQHQSSIDESLTPKPSNLKEAKSKQSFIESQSTLNSPSNLSTKTDQSTISIPNPYPITTIEQMSTVYEESEPSNISLPHASTPSLRKDDVNQINRLNQFESSESNLPMRRKSKSSSKEKSLSNLISKSSRGSNHRKKTIDAKTIVTSTSSITSINYEFRIQIGNESQFDGTNQSVSIEIINNKSQSMKIPLINSINNSKPFQKGQLDIFHFTIPNQFHNMKKINLILSQSIKDPLHIHYCELQDRQTMNTLYFPIENWLGENNLYKIELYLPKS